MPVLSNTTNSLAIILPALLKAQLARKMRRLLALVLLIVFAAGCEGEKDRYEPLALSDFFFHEVGATREYVVTPNRLSITEVVIYSEGTSLTQEMLELKPLEWKVKAQAFRDGKIIDEIYLKTHAAKLKGAKDEYYADMSLGSFYGFKLELFPSPVLIRLTVEQVDQRLSRPDETLKIGIRTSPVP